MVQEGPLFSSLEKQSAPLCSMDSARAGRYCASSMAGLHTGVCLYKKAVLRIKGTQCILCPFSLLLFPVLYLATYILGFNAFGLELSSFLRKGCAVTYV